MTGEPTWRDLAAMYPEAVQAYVQMFGGLPEGDVTEDQWDAFRTGRPMPAQRTEPTPLPPAVQRERSLPARIAEAALRTPRDWVTYDLTVDQVIARHPDDGRVLWSCNVDALPWLNLAIEEAEALLVDDPGLAYPTVNYAVPPLPTVPLPREQDDWPPTALPMATARRVSGPRFYADCDRLACPQCAALATRYPAPGRQPGTESRNRTGGHSDTHLDSEPANRVTQEAP